jgi:hypothetical protein
MTAQQFEITEPGKIARLFPLLLGVLAPLLVIAVLAATAAPVPWRQVLPPLVALPVVAVLFALAMLRRKVEIRDGALAFGILPWRRTPIAVLDLAAARIIDLEQERDWQPQLKLVGSRLPGYASGWFWLRNRRRAQVLLTDRRRVLMLPKRDGTLILLSAARPDALLAALRRADDSAQAGG